MLARQGLAEPKTILDELGINVPSNGNGSSKELGKRKAKRQAVQRFKKKTKVSDDDDDSDSSNDDQGSGNGPFINGHLDSSSVNSSLLNHVH